MASSSGGTPTTPTDTRRRPLRVALGCLLILAFLGSIIWIFIGWPLPLTLAVSLIIVAAAAAAVFAAYFVPHQPSVRFKRAVTVGIAAVGLITTLIAVPAIQNDTTAPPGSPASTTSETPPTTPSPLPSTPSTPSPLPDPLTATLRMGADCEIFALPTSQLPALSKLPKWDAKWVYRHGGATRAADIRLTVQGKGEEAVILQGLRVIELERNPIPTKVADIGCDDFGGSQPNRSFDINLGKPVRIVPKRGDKEPPQPNSRTKYQSAIRSTSSLK